MLDTFAGCAIVGGGGVLHAEGELSSASSSQLAAFEAAFSQSDEGRQQTFEIGSLSFVVVSSTDGRVMAVAKGRVAGVIVLNCQESLGGVLVCTWVKPFDAAAATKALDEFVARLRT